MSVHPSGRLALSVSKDKTLRLVSSSGLLESNSIESLRNFFFSFHLCMCFDHFFARLLTLQYITLIVWQLSTLEVVYWKEWQFFSGSFLFSFFFVPLFSAFERCAVLNK